MFINSLELYYFKEFIQRIKNIKMQDSIVFCRKGEENGDIKEKTAVLKTDNEGNSELIEQEFPSKLDTKLKALDTLNKMSGEYTTKIEGDLKVNKLEDLL